MHSTATPLRRSSLYTIVAPRLHQRRIANPVMMEYLYSFDYYTESWIEVSSQPSSSSLSSAATDDNTLGARRTHQSLNPRRRRRFNPNAPPHLDISTRPTSATGSSQEEYDESESESDRIMSSSNEEAHPATLHLDGSPAPPSAVLEDDKDDDENSTALGINNMEPVFTPQPNAFSHPPASLSMRHASHRGSSGSYFPHQGANPSRAALQRYSYPSERTRSHTPYNVIAPSYQADHDAALRASLSTLLSCAAAARGLPKRGLTSRQELAPPNRIEPSTLQIVPETSVSKAQSTQRRTVIRQVSETSSSAISSTGKGKRRASSRDRRDSKKKRHGSIEELTISPTLMTWVVSAGVVVLFSAISFSAGFAYGKEVGLVEGGMRTSSEGVACGREVGRGFRRLRWGAASSPVRV